jgi:hypothetical protein
MLGTFESARALTRWFRDCKGLGMTTIDTSVDLDPGERSTALFDVLRANAAHADVDRRPSEESVDAIREAGRYRVWNARRYCGVEADMKTQMEVCAER